ncbi:MAG: YfbK domain-containing protein [Gammaproteobacteria bacterium]
MNEQDLDKLLDRLKTPPVDENAKKHAIRLALAAFDQEVKNRGVEPEKKSGIFGKGLLARWRPTHTPTTVGRNKSMKITANQLILSGFASVCIAALGIWIFFRTSDSGFLDHIGIEPTSTFNFRRSPGKQSLGIPDTEITVAGGEQGSAGQLELADSLRLEESKPALAPAGNSPLKSEQPALSAERSTGERESRNRDQAEVSSAIVARAPLSPEAKVFPSVAPPLPAESLPDSASGKELGEFEAFRDLAQANSGTVAKAQAHRPPVAAPEELPKPDYYQDEGRDRFENFEVNPVKRVAEEPVSTFSVDVDTASYSFVRRQLNQGRLPQKDAVRLEEMVNYFDYEYPVPESKEVPFKPSVAVTDSPWNPGKKLLHIGIKGYEIDAGKKPRTNLVFLLDVSGSMNSPDKLPLVKQSMALLLSSLQSDDTVGIVVYAGAAGKILDPTPVKQKEKILAALNRLEAGGSTAGAQGIQLAYQLAETNFDKQAINRIVLATDGDFNVGITNPEDLQGFVERQKERGIFLSVLGFGEGNYHDLMMQRLAQNGNGVAAYIDTLSEAQKVLVDEATSTLFPIAKDVKIQVEFNPATVAEYRLLGYESRRLNREDFNNDAVDAGDIGAGHTVTAMYEITPVNSNTPWIDESRYRDKKEVQSTGSPDEYAFLKIRYKLPDAKKSKLITRPIAARNSDDLDNALKREFEFSTAVAGFAQLLRGGRYTGKLTYDEIIDEARKSLGQDAFGYRAEFIQLVRKAKIAQEMGS